MKKCVFCGNEFEPSKKDIRIKYCCSECRKQDRLKNDYMKDYYNKNKELLWYERQKTKEYKENKNAERRKKYLEDLEYREKIKTKVKEHYSKNPDFKKKQRIRKYNISLEEYKNILEKQNNKCLICGYDKLDDTNFFPVIDHCHKTNKVRGMLCMNCNMGLGKFKDNIFFLENAIKYLKGVL